MYSLSTPPLTEEHCRALGPYLRNEDKFEAALAGHHDPVDALLTGLSLGAAWAVLEGETVLGAFGQCDDRIWSLWRPLTRQQSRYVFKQTRTWVHLLVKASGYLYLQNCAWEHNTVVLRWLRATGCFVVDDKPLDLPIPGARYIRFRTLTAAHLAPKAQEAPNV